MDNSVFGNKELFDYIYKAKQEGVYNMTIVSNCIGLYGKLFPGKSLKEWGEAIDSVDAIPEFVEDVVVYNNTVENVEPTISAEKKEKHYNFLIDFCIYALLNYDNSLDKKTIGIVRLFLSGKSKQYIANQYNMTGEGVRQAFYRCVNKIRNTQYELFNLLPSIKKENEELKIKLYQIESLLEESHENKESDTKYVDIDSSSDAYKLLFSPIELLKFSVRAINVLKCLNCVYVFDIPKLKLKDLSNARNSGKKTVSEVCDFLNTFGLTFEMSQNEIMTKMSVFGCIHLAQYLKEKRVTPYYSLRQNIQINEEIISIEENANTINAYEQESKKNEIKSENDGVVQQTPWTERNEHLLVSYFQSSLYTIGELAKMFNVSREEILLHLRLLNIDTQKNDEDDKERFYMPDANSFKSVSETNKFTDVKKSDDVIIKLKKNDAPSKLTSKQIADNIAKKCLLLKTRRLICVSKKSAVPEQFMRYIYINYYKDYLKMTAKLSMGSLTLDGKIYSCLIWNDGPSTIQRLFFKLTDWTMLQNSRAKARWNEDFIFMIKGKNYLISNQMDGHDSESKSNIRMNDFAKFIHDTSDGKFFVNFEPKGFDGRSTAYDHVLYEVTK